MFITVFLELEVRTSSASGTETTKGLSVHKHNNLQEVVCSNNA